MLNETFPVSMAFVSTIEGGQEFAERFSKEILTAENRPFFIPGKRPVQVKIRTPRYPKIFLSGSTEECRSVKEYLEKNGVVGQGVANKIITCSTKTSWNWQQDFMQGHFNSSTGLPEIKINRDYYPDKTATGTFGDVQFKKLGPVISETCPDVEIHGVRLGSERGSMGGNFEGIPPHFCVVGTSDLENKFDQVSKKVCGDAEVIKAPTSFLSVGHTDEIMKTVPSKGPPPCNFRVLVADQSLGMELLENSKGSLFDIHENSVVSDYLKKIPIASTICLEAISLRQKSRDNESEETGSVSFLNNFIRKFFSVNEAHGTLGVVSKSNGKTAKPQDELQLPHPCEHVSGKEFANGLRNYKDNGDFSKIVDEKLDLFAADVRSRIKKKLPQCSDPDPIIRVPTLYYTPWFLHSEEPEGGKIIKGADAEAVFPNLTNSLVIGSKLIFSDQVVTPYNNFLKKIGSQTSMSHSTINTNFAHRKQGNLHCSSNLIRYCRPGRN